MRIHLDLFICVVLDARTKYCPNSNLQTVLSFRLHLIQTTKIVKSIQYIFNFSPADVFGSQSSPHPISLSYVTISPCPLCWGFCLFCVLTTVRTHIPPNIEIDRFQCYTVGNNLNESSFSKILLKFSHNDRFRHIAARNRAAYCRFVVRKTEAGCYTARTGGQKACICSFRSDALTRHRKLVKISRTTREAVWGRTSWRSHAAKNGIGPQIRVGGSYDGCEWGLKCASCQLGTRYKWTG